MPFPNFRNKHLHDSMFSPQDFTAYKKLLGQVPRGRPPEGVIVCYDEKLMKTIVEKNKTKKLGFFVGDFYLVSEKGNKIGIIGNFGIGAPAAVIALEELIALGVKKFITIGSAGTLSRHLKEGDIVLCDRAIRDEGTSSHYIKHSKYSFPSKSITEKIKKLLDESGQKYFMGTSWTIDSPYRETVAEARRYQKEDVLTVEMEASALFAVAGYRKVEMGALFTISDSLAELEWKPKFHTKEFKKSLENVFEIAKKVLMEKK